MRQQRRSRKPRNTGDLAYLGALVGMTIAGAHVFWHVIEGELPREGPLLHIALDLGAGTLAIAGLFAGVSGLRNRMARA